MAALSLPATRPFRQKSAEYALNHQDFQRHGESVQHCGSNRSLIIATMPDSSPVIAATSGIIPCGASLHAVGVGEPIPAAPLSLPLRWSSY
jgi:hypothetical protein